MEDKIILPEDKETAEFKTVSGWVSSNGYFYGDKPNSEHLARHDGSTHKKCDCGEIFSKNSYCRKCHDKKMDKIFNDMKKVEWDEKYPIVDYDTDNYFGCWEDVSNYCHDHGIYEKDLRLCHCIPTSYPFFDINDFLCDIMPDGSDVDDIPGDILAAADELNRVMSCESPMSWIQGDTAVLIKNP